MEKSIKVYPDDSIEKVRRLFKKNPEVHALIVINKNGKFLGEVHELDVLAPLVPEDLLDEEEVVGALGFGYQKKFFAKKVKAIMRTHQFTTNIDTDIKKIAYLMYKEEIRVVPVLGKTGKVRGILHIGNIIRSI